MSKLLREPLLHFLIAGMGFFLLNNVVNGSADNDSRVITVDRPALLTFLQYRSKAFDQQRVSAMLDALPPEKHQRLIDDYVREEALYREAKALELGLNDYIIKRRMIQKLEFITSGFVSAVMDIDADELKRYFEANKQQYYTRPYLTFTHVFFATDTRAGKGALALAEAELEKLRYQKVAFHEAVKYGERFLYHANYVEREADFVASHFGREMAASLFSDKVVEGEWRGPLQSTHGYHLVLISDKQPGRYAEFEEIADRVRGDFTRFQLKEQSAKTLQSIVDSYQVKTDIEKGEVVVN